jgi:hypothetical protein
LDKDKSEPLTHLDLFERGIMADVSALLVEASNK